MKEKRNHKKRNITILAILITVLLASAIAVYASLADFDMDRFNTVEYIKANDTAGKLWYEPNSNCIVFQTLDKQKSSNVYYHTIMFELSRVQTGVNPYSSTYSSSNYTDYNTSSARGYADPHVYVGGARQSIPLVLSGSGECFHRPTEGIIVDGQKCNINTYAWDFDTILNKIKSSYPDWYEEIKSGNCYIGIDGVLIYYNGSRWVPNDEGDVKVLGNKVKGNYYGYKNWTELGQVFSLGTPTKGIRSRYNQYLYITALEEEVPDAPVISDDTSTSAGDFQIFKGYDTPQGSTYTSNTSTANSGSPYATPYVYTYNESDEFDVGVAIPSNEIYRNGVALSAWYGNVGLSKMSFTYKKTLPYTITYNIYVTKSRVVKKEGVKKELQPDGSYRDVPYIYEETEYYQVTEQTTTSGSWEYETTKEYYVINNINLLELFDAKTWNDFSTAQYNNLEQNISYSFTINGVNVNSTDHTAFAETTFSDNWTKHVDLPAIPDTYIYKATLSTYDKAEADAHGLAGVQAYANANPLVTHSDEFSLNGTTYLTYDNTLHTENTVSSGINYAIKKEGNDNVADTRNIFIPGTTRNGSYYTSIEARYKRFASGITTSSIPLRTFTINGSSSKVGIRPDKKDNEPVNVYTPVIAPIYISESPQTQLTASQRSPEKQIVLDGTYTVVFDWDRYFAYKGYDNQSRFVNYVRGKYVRFPFEVMFNDTYYPLVNNGYTEWIDVGNVESFQFYLPTWAKEALYGATYGDVYSIAKPIEVKVDAINYISGDNWQPVANNGGQQYYEATYTYPVQVSGGMYGLTVTAVSDSSLFTNAVSTDNFWYNLVSAKQDIKVGRTNRWGENNTLVRYTKDGTTMPSFGAANKLPFSSGNVGSTATGALKSGTSVAYLIKTVGSLNSNNDYLTITPSYRYVAVDGTVDDNVAVYYKDSSGAFINVYNSPNRYTVALSDTCFIDSRYDYYRCSPVDYTVTRTGKSWSELMNYKTTSYTYGKIKLAPTQRLLTGDESELYVNRTTGYANILRYGTTMNYYNFNDTSLNQFFDSMQTWYGEYQVPDHIYVCKKYADGTDDFTRKMQNGEIVSASDSIWYERGYLVLNFDIASHYGNSNVYMEYSDATAQIDMWEREKNGETTTSVTKTSPDGTTTTTIPIRNGDVAIIDFTSSVSDAYDIGTLYLN